jgi:hypothetical protein
MKLVYGRLVYAVTSSLEVAARHNLERVANIYDERSGLIRDVVPLFVAAPDLQAGDGDREQQGRKAEVSVAVHAETLGCCLGGLLDWPEEGVAEIALAGGTAVRLDVIPEVVVRELENAREEGEKAAIHGASQVGAEGFDFVYERAQAVGCTVDIFPVILVPVKLLNAVGNGTRFLNECTSVSSV